MDYGISWQSSTSKRATFNAWLQGFQTYGYSTNFDYQITSSVLFRVEARAFRSKEPIFTLKGAPSRQNYCFTAALCASLWAEASL